jgi:hypothetical protein
MPEVTGTEEAANNFASANLEYNYCEVYSGSSAITCENKYIYVMGVMINYATVPFANGESEQVGVPVQIT